MLRKVIVGMGIPLCFFFTTLTSAGAQAPTQWDPGDSLAIGSTTVRLEVSTAKRVRVVLGNGAHILVSGDMPAPAMQRWAESVLAGLALGWRSQFEFENTLDLQQGVNQSGATGFVLTGADSVGETQSAFANLSQTEAFVALLEHAASRAVSGQSVADAARCEQVRDSVFARVAPRDWPSAKLKDRSAKFGERPPQPANAPERKPIVADVVMLPNGSLDSTYFAVSVPDDSSFKRRALEFLVKAQWEPAFIEGCPVVSKAGFITVSIGRRR